MYRGLQGSYEQAITSSEAVRSFIPFPLQSVPTLELTGSLARAHEQSLLALGRLDAVSALLPDPDLFMFGYVRREAVLSSQIEGTQSSLADLLAYEIDEAPGVMENDAGEVSNYVAALDHGLKRLSEGFPLSNRLLREMHAHLLATGRGADKRPGEFRTSQNWIGGTRPGNAVFVPPPPHALPDVLADLERFLHDPTFAYSPLVRAALAHVQFETIHPFLDGNGRLGRILIALILHHEGVLREPLLYLSLYLKQHRSEYYRLLDLVRTDGDWEAWLAFFFEGVQLTATGAVETAHRLNLLFTTDERAVRSLPPRGRATAMEVLQAMRQRPLASLAGLARRTDITIPAVTRAVATLIGLGIVSEVTGRRRDRLYVYTKYLAILNEETDPG
jgi:Fic family protein